MILISASLVVALMLAYNLTRTFVEGEFTSKKVEVLEKTIKLYNDFFQNKIPEITSYQGFLDSSSAKKYTNSVFAEYPFVSRIIYYDMDISNHSDRFTFKNNNLSITAKGVYRFNADGSDTLLFREGSNSFFKNNNDFFQMASKLDSYITTVDTGSLQTTDLIFKIFYEINANKISYLNIPRRSELKSYKNLLQSAVPSPIFPLDMMTFYLDPLKLPIINTSRNLYQSVSIRPLVYDALDNEQQKIATDIALPGAFSDYKLYFRSEKRFLDNEIKRRFFPVQMGIIAVYLFLSLIAWLIYRNLNVNLKLFKLQYDFINNFTHEFKTPVSVIKIAGSNLKNAAPLTERQRMHYGKILNEEADKLNELMNKLLSFTQLENKSIRIKKERISLDEFTRSHVDTFRIKYPNFKLSYMIKRVKTFQTDPVLLGSVFQNLIENAYKYSPTNRKELHIDIELVRRDIVFRFSDKGIGIANKEIGSIFKKFYRIQNQYNQNGSVGLGLAFCKELVNFMNGEIRVKSTVKEGSEFSIILPYEN
ncbi:MAG: sensor histidine kinase [Sphingobacteriaceae bacterium]